MKKILSIVVALGLTTTIGVTTISCGLELSSPRKLNSIDLSKLKQELHYFDDDPTHDHILERFNELNGDELNDFKLEIDVHITIDDLSHETKTALIKSHADTDKYHGEIEVRWKIRRKINDQVIDLEFMNEQPTDNQIKQAVVDRNDDLTFDDLEIILNENNQATVKAINGWQGEVNVKWSIRSMIDNTTIDLEFMNEQPTDDQIKQAVVDQNNGLTFDDLEIILNENNQATVKAINGWQGEVNVKWSIRSMIDNTTIDLEFINEQPTDDQIKQAVVDRNDDLTFDDLEIILNENNQATVKAINGWQGEVNVKWSIRKKIKDERIVLDWFNETPSIDEIKQAVVDRNNGLTFDDLEVGPIAQNNTTFVKAINKWQGYVVVQWFIRKMIDNTTIDLDWLYNAPSINEIKQAIVDQNDGLTLDDLEVGTFDNNQVTVKAINTWQGTVIVKWSLYKKIDQKQIDLGILNKKPSEEDIKQFVVDRNEGLSLDDLEISQLLDRQATVQAKNEWYGIVVVVWTVDNSISNRTIDLRWINEIPSEEEIKQLVVDRNEGLTLDDLEVGEVIENSYVIVTAKNTWKGEVMVEWKLNKLPTIYLDENGDKQETFKENLSDLNAKTILQIGYLKTGLSVKASRLPKTVEVVPTKISPLINSLEFMFHNATNFNQDLSTWDVSNIQNMTAMFNGTSSFNQDLSNWDVSNVTNMTAMFNNNDNFNQDISNWDVSNVTNMYFMFANAINFNQNISNWDVSNVTNMSYMFYGMEHFNQDISQWDVSKVTDMSFMFYTTFSFNQDLSNWDVDAVTNSTSFTQDRNWLKQHQPQFKN